MRHRTMLHIGGTPGAGKTRFIEALLAANDEEAFIVVRARRDAALRAPGIISRVRDVERDPELHRYLDAGAMTAIGYTFGSGDIDEFFTTDFMQEYSTAVVIEGDDPTGLADLNVHVMAASAPPVLVQQEPTAASAGPASALLAFLADAGVSDRDLWRLADHARRLQTDETRPVPPRRTGPQHSGRPDTMRPATPSTAWTISDTHQGIGRAQVVVVTVRGNDERHLSEARLAEVARLRGDPDVFADLRFRLSGGRTPITTVAVDFTNRKDPGTRKALARVRRTLRSTS